MLVNIPLLIPLRRDLIQATHSERLPGVIPPLAMWVISGNAIKIAKFQRELQSSAWRHGDKSPRIHMINSLGNGQAGAVNGTVILFHAL